jgi:hypothetical protein
MEEKAEDIDMLDLSRQAKLIPANEISQYTLAVFGIGSVGSHFCEIAGKTGFRSFELYDMDTVESENIGPQAFDMTDQKKEKVIAMKEILKRNCGLTDSVTANHGLINASSDLNPQPNTFYCCFFDSFEARQLVFDKLKGLPVLFVDGRIGMFNLRHYLINCTDEKDVEYYNKTLQATPTELACGEKACAPVNVQLAGKIVMNIVNYIKGKDYVKAFIGNAEMPTNDIVVLKGREERIPVVKEEKKADVLGDYMEM